MQIGQTVADIWRVFNFSRLWSSTVLDVWNNEILNAYRIQRVKMLGKLNFMLISQTVAEILPF